MRACGSVSTRWRSSMRLRLPLAAAAPWRSSGRKSTASENDSCRGQRGYILMHGTEMGEGGGRQLFESTASPASWRVIEFSSRQPEVHHAHLVVRGCRCRGLVHGVDDEASRAGGAE